MPWDAATDDPMGVAPRTTDAPRRAAVAVWTTAAAQLIFFGCCAMMLSAAGLIPENMLREELGDQVPEQQLDQLVQAQPALLISALVLLLVMFLPAFALLLLGFAVRRLSMPAIQTARAILFIQAGMIVVMLALHVLGGLAAGDILAAFLGGLLLGGTLVLIIWSLKALRAASRENDHRQGYSNEPWNDPMT
ncbi:hypothetical protein ACERK3_04735 [Phycisphaerales bacterium AB-hyl4]|uniref:Uncharacterized protein n=1 Tax=Natronomicrosphaera hydrolytica TaxID=3242702 RepID=A0ABV4U432_9BACT